MLLHVKIVKSHLKQKLNRWFVENMDCPHHLTIVTLSLAFFGMKYRKKLIEGGTIILSTI